MLGRADSTILSAFDPLSLKLAPSAQTLACRGNNKQRGFMKIDLHLNQKEQVNETIQPGTSNNSRLGRYRKNRQTRC
ncbi:hypothetical protein MARHY1986 [Marinobacter nauticus ATCC 49840]|nr:hypothetical protein MARHY1986 [Marinobacter nauticus ATCC 49840]